ncbi:hypothetical protein VNO77_01294 [Canavalia gladiata]|uniref:F-box protein At3g26010-like beta-propeller domain-containing protein n=1 Tax=Canavalia gladiata TaxID=3824 RepID=A0AAN9MR48_CANGL
MSCRNSRVTLFAILYMKIGNPFFMIDFFSRSLLSQPVVMATSDDMLLDVCSWLPAKSIYKFKIVSRLFSDFAKETYFISKQTQNALLKDDTCFFIQQDAFLRGNNEFYHLRGKKLSSGVSNDVLQFLSNSAKILASSNGLILYQTIHQNRVALFISNPATKFWLSIPTPKPVSENPYADIKISLKCDLDDCMMFLFYTCPDDWYSYYCKVYLFKEGVWKDKEEKFFGGGRNLIFDAPVHHNGVIYFISDSFPYVERESVYFKPYIMSYDLNNGKSRNLKVAKEARRGSHDFSCEMRIFNWGKITSSNRSICLVRLRKSVFTIWVLMKYESSLWRKILKVRVKAMGIIEEDPIVTGFTVLNGDLLIFATKKKVYSYGLKDEQYMRIQEIGEHECESNVSFISYSSTLRTCDVKVENL